MKKLLVLGLLFASLARAGIDVGLTKSSSPPSGSDVYAGNTIIYTLEWVVGGHSGWKASDVVIRDYLPNDVTYVDTDDKVGFSQIDNALTWNKGTLTSDNLWKEIKIYVKVNEDLSPGTLLINMASITTGTIEAPPEPPYVEKPNEDSATHRIGVPQANLWISKTSDKVYDVYPNSSMQYTINYGNSGPLDATGVVITDVLPASVTYQSCSPNYSSKNGNILTWNFSSLANGASNKITIDVDIPDISVTPASTTLTNIGSISCQSPIDNNMGNNISSYKNHVAAPVSVDLQVIKTGPLEKEKDALLGYTINYQNLGSNQAEGVVIKDFFDTNYVTYYSGGTYEGNGVVRWNIGNVDPGANVNLSLIVKVNGPLVGSGSIIINKATISTTSSDINQSNNISTWTTTVIISGADLWVKKELIYPGGELMQGEWATYTISYGNRDTAKKTAENIKIYESIPGEFESTSPSFPYSVPTNLVPGDQGMIFFTGKVKDNTASNSVTNIASITSTTDEMNPGDNVSSVITHVEAPNADLWAESKHCPNEQRELGAVNTYQIKITNNGPTTAKNIYLYDYLWGTSSDGIPWLLYKDAQDDSSADLISYPPVDQSGTVTWKLADLDSGRSNNIWVKVKVNEDIQGSTTLQNICYVKSTTLEDPNPSNNWVYSNPFHIMGPDLSITKTASGPSDVSGSDTVTFTLTYKNNGDKTANSIIVQDFLPTGFVYQSASPPPNINTPGASTRTLTWNSLGNLASGSTGVITIYTTVKIDTPASTTLTNVATISSATHETNWTNNQASASKHIIGVDVYLTKSAPGEMDAGSNFNYTLNYGNNGPGTARMVVITDNLPSSVTFLSSNPPSTGEGNNRTWNIGTLTDDQSGNISITVQANTGIPGSTTFINTATITTGNYQANKTNDSDSCDVHIAFCDVEVTGKSCNSGEQVEANELIRYTISYRNNGPGIARSCTLKDYLPAGSVTFFAAEGGGSPVNNVFTWNDIGTLTDDQTGSRWIDVRVNSGIPGSTTFRNYASITTQSSEDVGDLANNSNYCQNHVARPDVEVQKWTDNFEIPPGNQFTYTIGYRNYGEGATATGVVLTDLLPTNVPLTIVGTDGGVVTYTGGTPTRVTWNIGTLTHSSTWQYKYLIVKLGANAMGCTYFTNQATISCTNTPEVSTNNNLDSCENHVARPDVEVQKWTDNFEIPPGNQFTYTIGYRNYGEGATATGVVLTDLLPTNVPLTIVGTDGGVVTYTGGTPTRVTWNIGTLTHSSTWQYKYLIVKLGANAVGSTTFRNYATISCTNLPEENSNNNTDYCDNHVATSDVWVDKEPEYQEVALGANVSWTIYYGNNGPATATGVVMVDTLPNDVTITDNGGGVPSGNSSITWDLDTLASGYFSSKVITVTLGPSWVGSTTATNQAAITSASVDSDLWNNDDTVEVHIEGPDVWINKEPDYQELAPGSLSLFTITYGNAADIATATNVWISDAFPTQYLEFISSIPGTTTGFSWFIGTLTAGQGGSIQINFRVRGDAPASITTTNIATISCANECPEDLGNNIDDVDVHIQGADVWLTKGFPNPQYRFITERFNNIDVGEYAYPTFGDIDGDSDLDLIVGEQTNNELNLYKNIGSPVNPSWAPVVNIFNNPTYGNITTPEQTSCPVLVDIDNDLDLDLFVGGMSGRVRFYENTGSTTLPYWTDRGNVVNTGYNTKITFCDIDNDGLLDLFIGRDDGYISFYRNTGTMVAPAWILVANQYNNIDVGDVSSPIFCDIDRDGDYDLFIGNSQGIVYFYRNDGTPQTAAWTYITNYFQGIDVGNYSRGFSFADIDQDGDLDLFIGEDSGYINQYENFYQFYPNEPVQFNIAYGNAGNTPAQAVFVYDLLPTGFVYQEAFPAPTSQNGNYLTWNLGTLQPNAIGTIIIRGAISDSAIASTTFQNKASITTTTPECQKRPNNGTATYHIGTATMDLSIEKIGPAGAAPGQNINYTLNLRNVRLSPGLLGEYYNDGIDLDDDEFPPFSGNPNYTRVDENINYGSTVDGRYWTPYGFDNLFSVRWQGYLKIDTARTYNFTLRSDDHSWLYIDDTLVINYGTAHGFEWSGRSGSIYLTPGFHRIKVIFHENYGHQAIDLAWDVPVAGTIIPRDVLFCVDPSALGGYPASNVTAYDLWPTYPGTSALAGSLTYISSSLDAYPHTSVDIGTLTLYTWTGIDLPVGITPHTLIGFVNCVASTTIINTGSISGTPDADKTNNLGTTSAHVAEADIAIKKLIQKMPSFSYVTNLYNRQSETLSNETKPFFADIDNDGDLDMFVGRYDGRIRFSTNTGTYQNPSWASYSFLRSGGSNIDVGERASPCLVDIDRDGDLDLFVGQNEGTIVFYRNTGSPNSPVYTLVSSNYFNTNIGWGPSPCFVDIDGDGDYDCFVGEHYYGGINFFRNTGTPEAPSWDPMVENWVSIAGNYLTPTFFDLGQDGDWDLVVGEEDGSLNLLENIGTPQSPSWAPLVTNYGGINVSPNSAPTFCDIDGDGDADLFVGTDRSNTYVFFYEDTASIEGLTGKVMNFTLIYKNNKGVDMPNTQVIDVLPSDLIYNSSIPSGIVNGQTITWNLDTLLPYTTGRILLYGTVGYTAIGSNTLINYASITSSLVEYEYKNNIATASFHILGPDLVIYKLGQKDPSWTFMTSTYNNIDVGNYAAPSFCDIDADGDLDLFVRGYGDGNDGGRIKYYRNDGNATSPLWTFITHSYNDIDTGDHAFPAFVDIDGDGDYDLFVGGTDCRIRYYRNDGNAANPNWTFITNYYNSIDVGNYVATPFFCDIDGDSDFDLFIGRYGGQIYYYRNDGNSTSPSWTFVTNTYNGIDVGNISAPFFCDIDSDSDLDLFVGRDDGRTTYYKNTGSVTSPLWTFITDYYNTIDVGSEISIPFFCDIDGDGDLDLFIGNNTGNIWYYRNDLTHTSELQVGKSGNYLLKYKNCGAGYAGGAIAYDLLPYPLIFVQATPTQASVSLLGSDTLITWNIGNIRSNQEGNIVFTASAPLTAIGSTTLTNYGSITSATFETNLSNNTSSWQVHIKPPTLDVVIDKKVYKQGGFLAEYFNDDPNFIGSPVLTRIDPTIDFNWENGSPGPGVNSDNFSVRWTGMIYVKTAGDHNFASYHPYDDWLDTDDGMRVIIDDITVFDGYWNSGDLGRNQIISLSVGWHKIRVEYREISDAARAILWWTPQDDYRWQSIAPDRLYYPISLAEMNGGEKVVYRIDYANGTLTEGFLGEYFNNENLSGTPVLTRIDPTIDFSWGNGSPGSGVNSNNFSVRWTGMFYVKQSGNHRFSTYQHDGDGLSTSDGMRLLVDDITVFDRYWNDGDCWINSDYVSLSVGWHKIRVEYREASDNARAILWWALAEDWRWQSIAPARVFPGIEVEDASSVEIYDLIPEGIGSISSTRAPDSIIPYGTYTMLYWNIGSLPKWTRNSIIITGTTSESLISSTTLTNYASITTPAHEATKDNNLASSAIHILPSPIDLTIGKKAYRKGGLLGEYFNSDPNFISSPVLVRIDPTIDFNWGNGSPGPGVNSDNFSVRWTGMIYVKTAGNHNFASYHPYDDWLDTDNGMRVIIDDITVFDGYWNSGDLGRNQIISLSVGWHKIRVEYREISEPARAILVWAPADNYTWQPIAQDRLYYPSTEVEPGAGIVYTLDYAQGTFTEGFLGEYFNNDPNFIGSPVLTRIDPTIDFNWENGSPGPGVNSDNFSVRWTGMIYVKTAGDHNFASYHPYDDWLDTDDGMRVIIDDITVFDGYWNSGDLGRNQIISLSVGWHKIRVEYREISDAARAILVWAPADDYRWQSIAPARVVSSTLPYNIYARGVVVSDTFPSGLIYNTANPTPATPFPNFSWNIGDLRGRGWVIIAGTIPTNAIGSTTYINYASITTTSIDNDPTNNQTSLLIHVPGPQIYINKTSLYNEMTPGESIIYYLNYGNKGGVNAGSVTVYDWLPIEITNATFTTKPNGSMTLATQTLYYFNLGTLNIGNYGTITIKGSISSNLLGSSTIINVATISSMQGAQYPASCTSSWSLHIPGPDLYIYKFQPKEATFTLRTIDYNGINVGARAVPRFVDLDGDSDYDLLVDGNAAAPGNMIFYRNDGNPGNASWTLVSSDYAAGTAIVEEANDAHCFVDVDNDNDYDLFQGDGAAAGGRSYIERYTNMGRWAAPQWTSSNTTYIEFTGNKDKLVPAFVDIDSDGDFDLFVGKSDGKIAYLKNTGSAQAPGFASQGDVINLPAGLNDAAPAFIDIDNDLDYDLLVGASDGNVYLYRNTGTPQNPSWSEEGVKFSGLGGDCIPEVCDIDSDGDMDLFIGDSNGNIAFFENTTEKVGSTVAPEGHLTYYLKYGNNGPSRVAQATITDTLPTELEVISSIPGTTTQSGNLLTWSISGIESHKWATITVTCRVKPSAPEGTITNTAQISYPGCDVYSLNNIGSWSNFIGSMDLEITKEIRESPFTFITDRFGTINVGAYSSPAFCDMDKDGLLDMVIGTSNGAIAFFKNTGSPGTPTWTNQGILTLPAGRTRAHPCFVKVDGDSNIDLLVGCGEGTIRVYMGSGTAPANWTDKGDFYITLQVGTDTVDVGNNSAPYPVDIDNDGDDDLMVGHQGGELYSFTNNNGGIWELYSPNYANIALGAASDPSPAFFDADDDADFDLFIGYIEGKIKYYKNTGNPQNANFSNIPTENEYLDIDVGNNAVPVFADVDGNGKEDLLIGSEDGYITYFRNEGNWGTSAVYGKTIVYNLKCKKTGSLPADNVRVFDELPEGIDFLRYAITPSTYLATITTSGKLATWSFGNFGSSQEEWTIVLTGSVTGPASTTVTNYATITSDSVEQTYDNNISSQTSHITRISADVKIEKKHGRCSWDENDPQPSYVPVLPDGAYIYYYLYYRNEGDSDAKDVKIKDILPVGVEYRSASPLEPNVGTTTINGSETTELIWNIGAILKQSGTSTIKIETYVPPSIATGTILINASSITTTSYEEDKLDNISTWTTIVKEQAIDLVIEKTYFGTETVIPGNNIAFTLSFRNLGTISTLTDVVIVDDYDQSRLGGNPQNGLTFQRIVDDNIPSIVIGSTTDNSYLTIALGSITSNQTYSIDVVFSLSGGALPSSYVFNQASITYTGSLANETYLCNNSSQASVLIGTPTIRLYIAGTPPWGTGSSGEERIYSFVIYNDGNIGSGGTITITFPSYLSYVETGTSRLSGRLEPVTATYGATWTLQWVINPYIEKEKEEKKAEKSLLIGGVIETGTNRGQPRKKVGTPDPTATPLPFFLVNTNVGTITFPVSITITTEIEPFYTSTTFINPEDVHSYGTFSEEILIPFSAPTGMALQENSENATMISIPSYVRDGGLILYCIRFENNTNPSLIEVRDVLPEGFEFSSLEPPVLVNRNRTSGMIGNFTMNNGILTISFNGAIGTSGEIWFWGKTKRGSTKIGNKADISFDGGRNWTSLFVANYVDEIAPIIKSFDLFGTSATIIATWLGEDIGMYPSGIAKYILYSEDKAKVKECRGVDTQTTFVGEMGKAYSFYIVAIDNAGNKGEPSDVRTFQILQATYTALYLGDVIVFPNPYRLSKHRDYGISFGAKKEEYRNRNLTDYATIRIFNIKGELVKRLEVYPEHYGVYVWKNPENELASGVYIYIITNPQGQKCAGKLAIIK
ncbi:MAG: FG-GAP-like repeat-containing protein [bacterium]